MPPGNDLLPRGVQGLEAQPNDGHVRLPIVGPRHRKSRAEQTDRRLGASPLRTQKRRERGLEAPVERLAKLDAEALRARMRGRIVLDPWNVLDRRACLVAGLDHLGLGRPPQRATPS